MNGRRTIGETIKAMIKKKPALKDAGRPRETGGKELRKGKARKKGTLAHIREPRGPPATRSSAPANAKEIVKPTKRKQSTQQSLNNSETARTGRVQKSHQKNKKERSSYD